MRLCSGDSLKERKLRGFSSAQARTCEEINYEAICTFIDQIQSHNFLVGWVQLIRNKSEINASTYFISYLCPDSSTRLLALARACDVDAAASSAQCKYTRRYSLTWAFNWPEALLAELSAHGGLVQPRGAACTAARPCALTREKATARDCVSEHHEPCCPRRLTHSYRNSRLRKC
jgi:hypothetical protein